MRYVLLALLALLAAPAGAETPAADSFSLSADQWAQPRSGAALLELPPLHAAVADWLKNPAGHIVIQRAGNDVGSLWAGELQDWLVALGVPADHIGKRVSADQPDSTITLLVEH